MALSTHFTLTRVTGCLTRCQIIATAPSHQAMIQGYINQIRINEGIPELVSTQLGSFVSGLVRLSQTLCRNKLVINKWVHCIFSPLLELISLTQCQGHSGSQFFNIFFVWLTQQKHLICTLLGSAWAKTTNSVWSIKSAHSLASYNQVLSKSVNSLLVS